MSDTFYSTMQLCDWDSVESPPVRFPEDLEPGEVRSIMSPDLSINELL